MRKKKPTRGKKTNRRNKTTRPKTTHPKNTSRAKKTLRPKKILRAKKTTRAKKPIRAKRQVTGRAVRYKGSGAETAGQSGDIQGLSHVAGVDSESVAELLEEGQAFEAGVVSGVEDAPDADVAEVTTKEVPEDDVPPEYREKG
ncbi:MAG TPA: hypothetical protein VGL91_06525 [Acidobacteriota bacterium]|jgi:hypothetical protein